MANVDDKVVKEMLYVYCVTGVMPAFERISEAIADNIFFIYYKGLCAVVSKVFSDEFGEEELKKNLSDIKWIESRVLRHEKIIEDIMKNSAVIPFKFATIFNTEDSLKAMIDSYLDEFKDILCRLDGKEEWGVKMYCSLDRLKASLITEDEGIKRIEQDIKLSSAGKAYLLKKKRDELIENILNKKINEYGQDTFEKLNSLSIDTRINKLLPKEVTERKDDMILNATFLIDKSKLKDFIDSINFLKERYEGKGLDLDCTGPWPPYNFCSINAGSSLDDSSTTLSKGRDSNLPWTSNRVKKEKAI